MGTCVDYGALWITLLELLEYEYHLLRSLRACEPRTSMSHYCVSDHDVDGRHSPCETPKIIDRIEIDSMLCDGRFNLPPLDSPSPNIPLGRPTTLFVCGRYAGADRFPSCSKLDGQRPRARRGDMCILVLGRALIFTSHQRLARIVSVEPCVLVRYKPLPIVLVHR